VRLESRDGAWVDLTVLRRQRTEHRGRRPEEDWATDWLVVRGEVSLPGSATACSPLRWTFREPCLTPWEGRRLVSWLRSVADGLLHGAASGTTLRFAEPLLSLALDGARADRRLLRVHVTGAAAPLEPGTGRLLPGGVALDVGTAGLRRAAADWSADLDAVAP
jgi:hypothetical protein